MLLPAPGATLGPWTVGDEVVGPFAVPYVENATGEPADLSELEVARAQLRIPGSGEALPVDAHPDPVHVDELIVTFPGVPFTVPGLQNLEVAFTSGEGTTSAGWLTFVVDSTDQWYTLAGARDDWRDAPASAVQLWRLLTTAKAQVLEFGVKPAPDPIPDNWVQAQLAQARNIWNTVKQDPSNYSIGEEGILIRPFPLDKSVQYMIRPKRAKPVVR